MSGHIVSCFPVFSGYLWEACSFLGAGNWEGSRSVREGKLRGDWEKLR